MGRREWKFRLGLKKVEERMLADSTILRLCLG